MMAMRHSLSSFLGIFILFILFSSRLFADTNNHGLSVRIIQTDTKLSYSFPIRLSALLKDAYQFLDYTPYTDGSFLIDNSKQPALDQKKSAVFQKLRKLTSPSANQLLDQLKTLSYRYKAPVTLDLDKIRMFEKEDPIISGSYDLYLPKRFNTINVMGAIGSSNKMAMNIKPGASLEDYFKDISLQPDAIKFLPWVIQTDNTIHHIKSLYWEGTPTYLSPGAIIFIGLDDLPDGYQNLNEEIAQLLTEYVEM